MPTIEAVLTVMLQGKLFDRLNDGALEIWARQLQLAAEMGLSNHPAGPYECQIPVNIIRPNFSLDSPVVTIRLEALTPGKSLFRSVYALEKAIRESGLVPEGTTFLIVIYDYDGHMTHKSEGAKEKTPESEPTLQEGGMRITRPPRDSFLRADYPERRLRIPKTHKE